MQTLRLILKQDGKWKEIAIPAPESMTGAIILTWEGRPCRIHYNDGIRDFYAFGDKSVKWVDDDQKITMTVTDFANFWCYELLKFGLDTFTKIEMRDERTHIMAAEGETPESIAQVLKQHPLLYGDNSEVPR